MSYLCFRVSGKGWDVKRGKANIGRIMRADGGLGFMPRAVRLTATDLASLREFMRSKETEPEEPETEEAETECASK